MSWFRVLEHLLPRARAWAIKPGTLLRNFIAGLAILPDDIRREFDRTWLDIFPAYTRDIDAWEQQWALTPAPLTETQRRQRLGATWKARGGQSPGYIQDTLQAAGFPVFVHDWWVPDTEPPEPVNPFSWVRGDTAPLSGVDCGEPLAECGEEFAECGNTVSLRGYLLVNRVQTSRVDSTALCGEEIMECGEVEAECGQFTSFTFDFVKYNVPFEPVGWRYMFYVGGEVFGELATIPAIRRTEFETLVLKLKPAHLWAGVFIDYT